MDVTCVGCGKVFSAKRPNAKTCGDTCRKRVQRNPNIAAEAPAVTDPDPASEIPVGLVASTVSELAKAGRENSALGQAAILLAYRLERSQVDTGSSVAAMVKQHGSTLAEALKAAESASMIDELKARRDAKRAG